MRRFRLAPLLLALLLSAAHARSVPAQSRNPEEVASRLETMVIRIQGDLLQLRELAGRELVGRDRYLDVAPTLRSITAQDMDSIFRPWQQSLADIRNQIVRDRAAWRASRLSDEDYYTRSYNRVVPSINTLWRAYLIEGMGQLYEPNYGLVSTLYAEMYKLERRLSATRPPPTPDQLSAARKQLFLSMGPRYQAKKNQLADVRSRWAVELSGWVRFASERIVLKDDVHSRAAKSFELARQTLFGFNTPAGSTLDYWIISSGSTDRLITGYSAYDWCKSRPFPDVQLWLDNCGVLKMNEIGKVPLDQLTVPTGIAGDFRVRWEADTTVAAPSLKIVGTEQGIVAMKYRPGRKATLAIEGADSDLARWVKSIEVRDAGPRRLNQSVTYSRSQLRFEKNARGATVVSFDLDSLLRTLRTRQNVALLTAVVEMDFNGSKRRDSTTFALHPIQQKLMLFIPGAPGSRIVVKTTADGHCKYGDDAPEVAFEAWPAFSLGHYGDQPLRLLESNAAGESLCEVTSVDLFRSYGPKPAYDLTDREKPVDPSAYPRIASPDGQIAYFILRPWAYDWRARVERHVDELLGSGSGTKAEPPYAKPPSLELVISDAKTRHPFLDDKIAIVAHSTGGLITRSLLTKPGVERMVDFAFFISVPFLGAPKAYWVYLTGDFEVELLGNTPTRHFAPNTPVLYYLAPSSRYPGTVFQFRSQRTLPWSRIARRPGQSVGGFVNDALTFMRDYRLYPPVGQVPGWNEALERDAARFHEGIGASVLPRDRMMVFFSESQSTTIGSIRVGPASPMEYRPDRLVLAEFVNGDGTVPSVSQKGGSLMAGVEPILIPRGVDLAILALPPGPVWTPEHVSASREAFVWAKILERIERAQVP
jgi:hypothetical protein